MKNLAVTPLFLIAVCFSSLSTAEDGASRYGEWQSGKNQPQQLQQLVDRLRSLTDGAEKTRAADRYFLRDLRGLIDTYDQPWQLELIYDNFRDGDYTRNPTWTVTEGGFSVSRLNGLGCVVTASTTPAPTKEEKRGKGADLAIALLATLMEKSAKNKERRSEVPQRQDKARIHTVRPISDAFAIRMELTKASMGGHLEFGPYIGTPSGSGYRLAFRPGDKPELELLRITRRGTAIVEAANGLPAPSSRGTHLEWTRKKNGEMSVSVDGKRIFQVLDRGLKGPFDGFEFANLGGEFALGEISIHGAPDR